MLHHLSLAVTDLERAARFYDAALEVLGYGRAWSYDTAIGYGPSDGGDQFAIKLSEQGMVDPPAPFHLAFAAPDRDAVAAFHRAGLANDGSDSGGPGVRPVHAPGYYAAYVIDPDGYNIEAVINDP